MMQPAVQDIPKLLVSDVVCCIWERAPKTCPALAPLGEMYQQLCETRWMSVPTGWQIGIPYKALA